MSQFQQKMCEVKGRAEVYLGSCGLDRESKEMGCTAGEPTSGGGGGGRCRVESVEKGGFTLGLV
jgi:hypothetical protein